MRRVSIRELHEHTGKLVRTAAMTPLVVTDRGQTIAILRAPSELELAGKPFPRRKRTSMPKVRADSTEYISEDRR